MAKVEPAIKYIQLADGEHEIYDEYARKRLEGLSTVYSISSAYTHGESDTYTDWDTGATVAYSAMTIKNGNFASTDDEITISKGTGEQDAYLVLTSLKSENNYYVKKMTEMQLGDTVYVIEAATVAADRWLSAFTESPLSGTFKALNEKIDLSEYAKKTEAAKPGTYTTSGASTETSGQGGEQTATGTATVTYKKADATTGSAGAVSISYQPTGNISGTQTLDAHSHTVNLTKATVSYVDSVNAATGEAGAHTHSVSVSGDITLGDLAVSVGSGTATYTPSGSVAQPTFSDGSAAEAGAHTHTVTAKGSISVGTGTVNYTPAGTISEVAASSHSHSIGAETDTYTAITAIPNFSGGQLNAAAAQEVVTGVTAASLTGDTTFIKSASLTSGGELTGTKTFATEVTGTKNFGFTEETSNVMTAPTVSSDGILSWTLTTADQQDTHTVATGTVGFTAAAMTITTGTVGITGGAASGTISVIPSYTLTAAALGTLTTGAITYVKSIDEATGLAGGFATTPTFSGTGVELKFTGSSATTNETGAHLHTVTGTISTPTFTGTGVALKVAGGSVSGSMSGIAAEAGAHTHSVTASTATFNNVTGATLDVSGSATVDFSKATFTGATATLTQAAHTHDVVVAAHTHTISSSDASATGTASVAVANHTHSIGHTHTVTVDSIA